MSTATAFIFPRSFPFCAEDISGDVDSNLSHVGNLTLAEVMAFAWNLETFTLTPTGTTTRPPIDDDPELTTVDPPTFTLSPLASNYLTHAGTFYDGMWFGDAFAFTALASCPEIRTPVERICEAAPPITGGLLAIEAVDALSLPDRYVLVEFWIGTDPSNSGKYRLYYAFDIVAYSSVTDTVSLQWSNESSPPGGGFTSAGSGTITIAGITLNWYAYCTTGSTPSGVGLTASSTSFTY